MRTNESMPCEGPGASSVPCKGRKAFTIVELLVVIGILAVLMTIIVVAASGVQKAGREKRAAAMCAALEQAISAYYAQEGKWPDAIEKQTASMEDEEITFNPSATDDIFREVIGKAYGKGAGSRSMLVDATALFVARTSTIRNGGEGCHDNHTDRTQPNYCGDQGCVRGVDFSEAVKKGGKNHIPFAQMSFGYPGKEYGRFCRFRITYNGKTDSVRVSK